MEPIRTAYRITVADFRQASYYGLFLRYRKPFLFLFLVVGGALLYALAAALGFGTANPLVFFLAAAYAFWGLVMAAGVEKGIRAYLRSPDSLLGCEFTAVLDAKRIRLCVAGKGIDVTAAYAKLACAFELHALFMLYTTPQQVYLLPKRALTQEQAAAFRGALKKEMKERFGTRFGA
ncbi:MAG: YcxB family protein [Clostridia bacterium]|nr:YcxB family protein [Clostridia bacterium]